MERSASTDSPALRPIIVHISGFGKFQGVPENPTTLLVPLLADALSEKSHETGISVSHVIVMETSMMGVRTALESCEKDAAEATDTALHLWLHFGVASTATCVYLENAAVNDADFRVPDEQGEQPQKQQIESAEPWGCRRHCALPLHAISATLTASGLPVMLSNDAGRFLCNWAYYKSLVAVERLNSTAILSSPGVVRPEVTPLMSELQRHHSLFVHIPSFNVIPLDGLVAIAFSIVTEIASAMRVGTEPYISSRNSLQRSIMAPKVPDSSTVVPACPTPSSAAPDDMLSSLFGHSKAASTRIDLPSAKESSTSALNALLAFGFPRDVCLAAIAATATGADDPADRAAEWVFDHGLEDHKGGISVDTVNTQVAAEPRHPSSCGKKERQVEKGPFKLVIVARSDLNMRPGKVAAQASHGELRPWQWPMVS